MARADEPVPACDSGLFRRRNMGMAGRQIGRFCPGGLANPLRAAFLPRTSRLASPVVNQPLTIAAQESDHGSPPQRMTPSRFATYFHVHLVSDSTGETLNAMAKAVCARFDHVLPIEHIYSLVRSPRQLERVLHEIEGAPGVVLHTIVDADLRAALEQGCRDLELTCV